MLVSDFKKPVKKLERLGGAPLGSKYVLLWPDHFIDHQMKESEATLGTDSPVLDKDWQSITWGLIYNRCVHTKQDLKDAYASSYANVVIYRKKLDGIMCAYLRKL